MTQTSLPGGSLTLADDLTVTRMGYGAMQLAGPHVFGPPRDHDEAVRVLRAVVELGITNIDTAEFYGPHVTNRIIREALHPYTDGAHVVTKVGAERDEAGNWPTALAPEQLRAQVHANLDSLGLDALDVVNLRAPGSGPTGNTPTGADISEPFGVLADLQQQGLIRHLGLSTVTSDQVAAARAIAPVVCVQNFYNIANRDDDALLDELAAAGVAFVPFFPLGGFSPVQSGTLDDVAARLSTTPMALALAWLLQRSPNVLLIPGTSSVAHLRDNVAGAALDLPADVVAELDSIAG